MSHKLILWLCIDKYFLRACLSKNKVVSMQKSFPNAIIETLKGQMRSSCLRCKSQSQTNSCTIINIFWNLVDSVTNSYSESNWQVFVCEVTFFKNVLFKSRFDFLAYLLRKFFYAFITEQTFSTIRRLLFLYTITTITFITEVVI